MKPELLAPCRNWPTLKAAVFSGADAVYFGVGEFNMRMISNNFGLEDLPEVVRFCHDRNVKTYLTLNSIIYENEFERVEKIVKRAKEAGVDAIIIQDLGVIPLLKKHGLSFHISTQASVSNSRAVNMYASLGAERVVLARECNIKDVKRIVKNSKIGIELFIHGSMCVSISGRCFFSYTMYGKSADRGECMQPCRQRWVVKNDKNEFIYTGKRFLNAKDLCTLPFLDKLLDTGAVSFKIEGRRKDSNYISTVVKVYREAIDNFDKKRVNEWMDRLRSVFNRGFDNGFYLGLPGPDSIDLDGEKSQATYKKVAVGIVKNYYPKVSAAEVYLNHTSLSVGDEVIIEGATTFIRQKITSIEINHKKIDSANKDETIAILVEGKVRKGDEIYKFIKV